MIPRLLLQQEQILMDLRDPLLYKRRKHKILALLE